MTWLNHCYEGMLAASIQPGNISMLLVDRKPLCLEMEVLTGFFLG